MPLYESGVNMKAWQTHRDVGVQLQQGGCDVGRQGHVVAHSSLSGRRAEHSVTVFVIIYCTSFTLYFHICVAAAQSL